MAQVFSSVFLLDSQAYTVNGAKKLSISSHDDTDNSIFYDSNIMLKDGSNEAIYDDAISLVTPRIGATDIIDSAMFYENYCLKIRYSNEDLKPYEEVLEVAYDDLTAGEKTKFDALITYAKSNL